MSTETKQALDDALAAHVLDEADGMVSGYVLHAAYFSAETVDNGSTGYIYEFADGQSFHIGYGLAMQLVDRYRDGFEEEDDV